jgi:NNP family nitrate/nitrite transporter-like MFS transporter
MPILDFNLLNLREGKIRTLHLAWFAFFVTFVIWFNHAPLLAYIREALQLGDQQVKALLILNVALTIPARIAIGMLIDRFGPRAGYTGLLAACGLLCFAFASAQTFEQLALARFGLGFVGAGFVIGIRLVSEWFPAREVGLAEGIYGGWGNFGSAAAAMTLPAIAVAFGGANGWRYASTLTGLVALVYAGVFYRNVRNTPRGSTYFKPRRSGGLEVTSRRDFYFYLAMNVPMYLALGALAWKLSPANVGLLSDGVTRAIWLGLAALFAFQASQIHRVNREMLRDGVPEIYRYRFKQVAILDLSYLATFGAELAVVSMLPLFFLETFEGMGPVEAGLLGSGFAFMNLVARPLGGWLSDRFGRRWTLQILVLGMALGFAAMAQITAAWSIPVAMLATLAGSFFVNAGNGAVFAVVPLVQRRMTGQIAGMAGAYGNVGGVAFLTVLSFVDYSTFFLVIAGSAAAVFATLFFLDEPSGHIAEVREDGSIELIEVA